MSLPIPLSVRLVTSRADRHITRDLRDLSFRDVAIGGWASARMSLDRPLSLQPDEIAYYGRVYIYDRRHGRTVWEGRLEDPGRGASGDGQVWDLTAMGPAAHAHDRAVPLQYVDRNVGVWYRDAPNTPKSANITIGADGRIEHHIPRGTVCNAGAYETRVKYDLVADAGQDLGRVAITWDAGVTDSSWRLFITTRDGGGAQSNPIDVGWSTAGATSVIERGGGTPIPAGHDLVAIKVSRISTNQTIANDDTWLTVDSIVVRGMLKTAAGVDITSGYSANTVLASEVVKDLLGRLLTAYDGANATVTTTLFPIEQLAYPDAVTSAKVLDDLLIFEPAFRWGAYESNASGLHRFEWIAWPTTVRYEASAVDGFDSPGSADGLYSAVRVRYRDPKGAVKTRQRTQTVPELTAASLTREAFMDLGDDAGATTTDADRAGDGFLADHLYAPNQGRLVIARPIQDLVLGRKVMPWEIKAGELIRVRGVLPRVDALNATARDGTTVFRIWSREYSAAQAAAVLELDSYSRSTAAALADLAAGRITRRR